MLFLMYIYFLTWGRCGTLGSTTSIHETWTVFLQVTSPGICLHKAQVPDGARASQYWFTGHPHGFCRLCFVLAFMCVCVCNVFYRFVAAVIWLCNV